MPRKRAEGADLEASTVSEAMSSRPPTRGHLFHVSPSVNRDSIHRFGLDWRRMPTNERGLASGWQGRPETDGVFLTDKESIEFFVRFGSGRPLDIWQVDASGLPVEPGPDGWWVCRSPVPFNRIKLIEAWATYPGFEEPTPLPLPRLPRRRR